MLKKLRIGLLSLFGVVLFLSQLHAQDRQVTGKVSDENGAGLPGANILVKGTTRGTNTDAEGAFSIGIPSGGTLIISTVGYISKEISVSSAMTTVNVSLEPDVRNLGEVVVTALGIERNAKTLTYATQKIDGKQLTDVRDANFVNTLSGKVAGLVITQGSSGPGSAARVTLRGNRSIAGNNNALFVVDGVPVDNTVQGQVGSDFGGTNGSDGASNINPDDIESMNVLKGAAASALYGSRAANGVIMITTKKGKAGAVSASINSGVVMENPFLLPKFQNTYGQVKADGGTSWGPATTTYPNNVKDFFRTGVSTNNSFGISAGSEKVQTYASYTNNYNQGIIPNNSLMRHTLNLRLSTQITKKFSTDAKITYVNQTINNKPRSGEESGLVMNAYKVPRNVDLNKYKEYEDANGEPTYWTTSSIYMNPYWSMNKTSDLEKRNRTTVLGSAKYQLTDWLNVQGRISLDRYDDRVSRSWSNRTLLFAGPGGSFEDYTVAISERNLDVIFSGNNNLGKDLALTYNFGAGQTYKRYSQNGALANGLLVPNKFDLSFAASLNPRADFSEKMLQYVFGTASLSYKDMLTVDFAARNDWSSTLPKPYSYFYPSFGANLILSEAISMPDWISFAKIRGSWAQVGNDTDPYRLKQAYSFSQGGTGGFISRDDTQPAANLKPEISSSTEFGIDLRTFDGRLGLDVTYYNSNTVNQLLKLALAPGTGFANQFINAGKINNKGIEVSLTAKPIKAEGFTWDMTLNFARNKNTIVKLDPNIKEAALAGGYGRTASPVVREGGSYGDLVAQVWARDSTTGQFIVTAPDVEGKNGGKPVVADGLHKIGNFNPKFTLGFNNQFSYKAFTLSFLIDGRFGGTMTSGTEANLASDGTAEYTTDHRDGGWILPGVTSKGEANTTPINAEAFWTTVSGGRYSWGEFFSYSTTNVRLREVSLGYNIPVRNSFIKNARVSFIARNLLFLYRGYAKLDIPGVDKRKLPFDPDVNLGAGNFQGVEYGNLPSTRTIGLNVKLGF